MVCAPQNITQNVEWCENRIECAVSCTIKSKMNISFFLANVLACMHSSVIHPVNVWHAAMLCEQYTCLAARCSWSCIDSEAISPCHFRVAEARARFSLGLRCVLPLKAMWCMRCKCRCFTFTLDTSQARGSQDGAVRLCLQKIFSLLHCFLVSLWYFNRFIAVIRFAFGIDLFIYKMQIEVEREHGWPQYIGKRYDIWCINCKLSINSKPYMSAAMCKPYSIPNTPTSI